MNGNALVNVSVKLHRRLKTCGGSKSCSAKYMLMKISVGILTQLIKHLKVKILLGITSKGVDKQFEYTFFCPLIKWQYAMHGKLSISGQQARLKF